MSTKANARVYQDDTGAWRWRLRAANGEIVAIGEAYTRRGDAKRGLKDAQRAMADAAQAEDTASDQDAL